MGGGAEAAALSQGHINKSLFALGNVCEALYHNAKAEQAGRRAERHVPFRDSKLTHLCQNAFGGNSVTHLVVTCSTAAADAAESLATLQA